MKPFVKILTLTLAILGCVLLPAGAASAEQTPASLTTFDLVTMSPDTDDEAANPSDEETQSAPDMAATSVPDLSPVRLDPVGAVRPMHVAPDFNRTMAAWLPDPSRILGTATEQLQFDEQFGDLSPLESATSSSVWREQRYQPAMVPFSQYWRSAIDLEATITKWNFAKEPATPLDLTEADLVPDGIRLHLPVTVYFYSVVTPSRVFFWGLALLAVFGISGLAYWVHRSLVQAKQEKNYV